MRQVARSTKQAHTNAGCTWPLNAAEAGLIRGFDPATILRLGRRLGPPDPGYLGIS